MSNLVQRISMFLRSPKGQQLVERGRRELASRMQAARSERLAKR
jgi:hypothetical protein